MLFLRFFHRYLFSDRAGSLVKRIAWICMIGVGIGLFAFVVALSVMGGLNQSIRERVLAMEPHLFIQIMDSKDPKVIETHPAYMRLKSEDGYRAYVFETQDVILRTIDGHFRGAIARGVSSESMTQLVRELKKSTEKSSGEEIETVIPGENEILIGADLARMLGVFEGDSLTIIPPESLLLPPGEVPKFEKVRVRQIISTSLADMDAKNVYYVRGKALTRFSNTMSRVVGVEAWTPDPFKLEQVQIDLLKLPMVRVETWTQKNSDLFFSLKVEKMMIGLFLTFAAMITCFSIATVISLLISQKKREIGILAAMGFSKARLMQMFTSIGFLLAIIGGGVGYILGAALSLYIEINPVKILPDIYYDSQIPAQVDGWFLLATAFVAAAVAFFAAYIPAKTVLELNPSEALRAKN